MRNRTLLPLLFALPLSACSAENVEIEEAPLVQILAELGIDRYIGIEPATSIDEGGYGVHRFAVSSPARCLEGTEFVVTTHDGSSPNAMLFLEGGGACWDYESCYEAPVAKHESGAVNWADLHGILDAAEPANTLRDWNVVYASYCDGSIWSGDADIDYGGKLTYHHGLANLSAAVTLLKKKYPNPPKIVVSGSSAGGYGTLMGYMVVRSQFPTTPIYVINDSGPWLLNPDKPEMTEAALEHWGVRQFFPPGCPKCQEQMYYIADWAMNRDRDSRWGLFSFENDFAIGTFYLSYGGSYPAILDAITAGLRDRHPGRYNAYLLRGSTHTIFTSSAYYEAERDGVRLNDWVEAMVSDDRAWRDVRGAAQ